MARRTVLTERQREALFGLPADHTTLLRHCILSEDDLSHVRKRRRDRNRLGYAIQLCALRYPGRLIPPGELIPEPMLAFVAGQLGVSGDDLADYAERDITRYQHSAAIQRTFGFRAFEGRARAEIVEWLTREAEQARTNEGLARALIEELRARSVIVPASSTVERLCADALVKADRTVCARIADRLELAERHSLSSLLEEVAPGTAVTTLFVWLRKPEPGSNSNDANALLDRLDVLTDLGIDTDVLRGVPLHRIASLRRQGERYYADGMRRIPESRRLAILAVCAIEWRGAVLDAVAETHDRVVGRLYKTAERACATHIADRNAAVAATLRGLAEVGDVLLAAKEAEDDLDAAVTDTIGWLDLAELVGTASNLTAAITSDPFDFVGSGYPRFRRYVPRMLASLDLRSGPAGEPLLRAVSKLRELNEGRGRAPSENLPIAFARPKWRKRLVASAEPDRRTWEMAVLFALRDALRSGDVWIAGSRRYREPTTDLVTIEAARAPAARLAVPLNPVDWIESRRTTMSDTLRAVAHMARHGGLPGGAIEDGQLHPDKLERATPHDAGQLTLDLYGRLPDARITDILLEADADTGFTEAFTDLRKGTPCTDKIGLLSVILADGVNLGLKKMAASGSTHSHMELLRIARWHVEQAAYDQALATVVDAQAALPLTRLWGEGLTSASDGQFFPAGGPGEAIGLVNAKYSNEPGVKAYTHVSDQYAPFSVRTIPATASEAPYILDGLLMNEAGQRVREHYADTGGFTDQVFAACTVLGYAFAPRIRDLPDKRIYALDLKNAPKALRPLIARQVRTDVIERNWPDILRLAASMSLGTVVPSEMLRKLAAYPRQNELAEALREVGRVERSLFMLRWITDPDLQRRAQTGLNKGEAHHALKRAIAFHRRGEIRDRTTEGQHFRMAGLNLLTMIVIYWNTKRLGEMVMRLAGEGSPPDPELLRHVSPLGWEHIHLAGEYRWPTLATS